MDKRGREFRFVVPFSLSGSREQDLLHNYLSYNNTFARLDMQMIDTCREIAKISPEVIHAAHKIMVG
jgi:hypothetical protein